MKKQVLSFNEFIFEAYRILESDEDVAGSLIDAIGRLERSGVKYKEELGIIAGIAKLAANKDYPDTEGDLAKSLLGFIEGIEGEGIKITGVDTKMNVINYDNVVSQNVLVGEGEDATYINLIEFINDLNVGNASEKIGSGTHVDKGKTYWNKVQTDKRFGGIGVMSNYLDGKKRFGARTVNFFASFFLRNPSKQTSGLESQTKDTKYLSGTGLLGNTVITDVESTGSIVTKTSIIESRDMIFGGKASSENKGKKRKGFSNLPGDKKVATKPAIQPPYKANLPEKAMDPTSNKSAKTEKGVKAYFTLVLYSFGDLKKSDREIPYTKLVLTSKLVPTGKNVETFELDVYDSDEKGNQVLFDVNSYKLSPAGKNNINRAIEEFNNIDSIQVKGFASKEGDVKNNETLCIERAKSVAEYIKSVPDWEIKKESITASSTPNIQPKTGKGSTDPLKSWRKIRLVVKGTKLKSSYPEMKEVPYLVPTLATFNPDQVDIKQICITFEVSPSDVTRRSK